MTNQPNPKNKPFELNAIGHTEGPEEGFQLVVYEPYRPALYQLDLFSHVLAFWWLDQHDDKKSRQCLQSELPYAEGINTGVFACRSDYRPNPIALTICKILDIDHKNGIVQIDYIDAHAESPLIDLKPYIPVCERIREYTVPEWYAKWPEWLEDGAEFFSKYEF